MTENPPFKCVLSLRPLIEYWEQTVSKLDDYWRDLFRGAQERLAQAPELLEPIHDLSVLEPHRGLIESLMRAVFPPAFWESEAVGALVPFSLAPVHVSPTFRRLLLNEQGTVDGRLFVDQEAFARAKLIRFYLLILRTFYGIDKDLDYPLIWVVEDPDTGLDRYFRFRPDLRFVQVHALKPPKPISDDQRAFILHNLATPEVFRNILSPEDFEFRGFTVVQAVDVTQSETLAALERDMVDKQAIFSDLGFARLQNRLRTLFRKPEIFVGIAAIKGDRALMINSGCKMGFNCIFMDSEHQTVENLKGSLFDKAWRSGKTVVVSDLLEETQRTSVEENLIAHGKRSLLLAPLQHQGKLIGTLDLYSKKPGDLGPMEEMIATQIQPLFAMALQRALEELDNQVDGVIKEKCTAIHPSVEWRFRQAALDHLEMGLRGENSEMQPIVFKDVYPLYGATDIRGSSDGRNRAIQADLCDHLVLALDVIHEAWNAKSAPLLEELAFRTGDLLQRIQGGLGSGDELTVIQFIERELAPLLCTVRKFGPSADAAVRAYEEAVDVNLGTVYRKRKDFEDSVSKFNQRISAYVEREQSMAQEVYPHYFEKHQTDGLEYLIYIGESMSDNGDFNQLYVKSLRLWQINLACGVAWLTDQLKSDLKVGLDATHLILDHHSPLSVRFRFDEKRFDVDGAYDVGHEIVRSRIDKATLRGRNERLTQPGKIAIVYSRPEESKEMVRHIHFLQSRDFLLEDLEAVDLDDLPGVQGLKALRVSVNVKSPALAARMASCRRVVAA